MKYSDIYQISRLFFRDGWKRRHLFNELERSQWLSSEEIQVITLEKIKYLVHYAYDNVPYYRNLYSKLDIHPQDISSIHDFQKLPFLTKEDVLEHRDDLISTKFDKKQLHMRETGGSTGIPMQFFIDETFWLWATAYEQRAQAWYGIHEGDKIAWIWGVESDIRQDTVRSRIRASLMRHRYLNALTLTDSSMKAFAEMLVDWQPDLFSAYPSSMSFFARYVKEHHIRGIHPRLIVTTSEKITPDQRRLMEDVFGCPVADNYGSTEMAQIAFQCPQGNMHINESLFLELIANGKPVADGETGEVVITNLFRYAMPFIRYKVADLAVASTSKCACGRGLPVLHKIVGRLNDYVILDDGRILDETYFDSFFKNLPQLDYYQIHQSDFHHIHVNLVPQQPVDGAWLETIQSKLNTLFGLTTKIDLKVVEKVELTSNGKFRVVSSEIQNGAVS